MKTVLVITTGGTIAKIYRSGIGVRGLSIGSYDDPHSVPSILTRMIDGNATSLRFARACQVDSLDMSDYQRSHIAQMCQQAAESRILVTHGTDTAIKTASAIHNRLRATSSKKTVILTGSLLPACIRGTDAEFNLGLALGACLSIRPGVYIALNGVYPWNKCRKDPKTGMFVPK